VGILVLNPLRLEITDPVADPELVDSVDKVDTDRPLPDLALVDLVGIWADESELTEVDLEPSRNRRRGGRSISANVGRGTDILVDEWCMELN
jgi:hypothetical protein